ncbi:MAG: hypothetical protein HQ477_06915 [Chloroflexi bacterium]|nr:hypothetical protein [Chloroflexota bacterium]
MKLSEITEVKSAEVRVIGIGGAGCSTLNRLAESVSGRIRMLGIDTGSAIQGLYENIEVMSLGSGFGSGGSPEVAADQFLEVSDDVNNFINGADVVILLAGLGRGTGSGLSPKIAELARRLGVLTIAAVSMPFEFEGSFRDQFAIRAHDELKGFVNAIITMSNNDLAKLNTAGTSVNGAFQVADKNIADAVHVITTALESSPERFTSLKQTLSAAGETVVLSGQASDLHGGRTAVANAFDSTVKNIGGTDSIVIHVEGGIGLSLGQVAEAVTTVRERIGRNVVIHVTSQRLIGMGQDIKVTMILGGVVSGMEMSARITPIVHFHDLNRIPSASIFDSPTPRRTRGPILLPTG